MEQNAKAISAERIIGIIHHLENNIPVNDWKVAGIEIWPVIRSEIYYFLSLQLVSTTYQTTTSNKGQIAKVIGGLSKYLSNSIRDRQRSILQNRKTDVIFLGDGISFTRVNGEYYDRFCDPVIVRLQQSGLKTLKLEPAHYYLVPRFLPSKFIQPFIDLRIIAAKFSSKKDLPVLPGHDFLLKYLEEHTAGLPVFTSQYLADKAYKINAIAGYLSTVMKAAHPKLAFITSYYSDLGFAYILACKQLRIPVADFQHGVQGPLHAAYGSWSHPPAKGYQLLPDYFWCWSAQECEAINQWAEGHGHKALEGGNVLLDAWKRGDMPETELYDRQINTIAQNLKGERSLVLTLQYGLTSKKDLQNILQVIKETQNKYNWFVRLHPMMLAEMPQIEKLFADHNITNYNIQEATAIPLYALLRNMDLHITHSSSTVIEAAHFGIPSILFDPYGVALFQNEMENAIAFEGSTVNQIVMLIQKTQKIPYNAYNNPNFEHSLSFLLQKSGLI